MKSPTFFEPSGTYNSAAQGHVSEDLSPQWKSWVCRSFMSS